MAINQPYDTEDSGNPLDGVLKGVAALGPVAVGGAVALNRFSSNTPINPSSFGVSNTFGELGRTVGQSLRSADTVNRARRQEAAERLAKKLVDSDGVKSLLAEIQDQNTVIQSIISTLDDPKAGITADPRQIAGYKERLQNAASKVSDKADVEELLSGMIHEIFSTNEDARGVLEGHLREFRGLRGQLTAPTFSSAPGQPFMDLSEGHLTSRGRARYERLNKLISRDANGSIKLVASEESTGAIGHYARIFRTTNNGDRFVTMIPLDIAANADPMAGPQFRPAYNIVRTGEAGTAYRGHRHFIEGEVADSMIRGRKEASLGVENLRNKRGLIDVEDYYLKEFERRFTQAGNIFGFDKNRFNAFVRENLAVESRLAGQNSPLGKHLSKLGALQANTAAIVGLQHVDPSRRMDLIRALARSGDFDFGVGADRLAEQRIEGRRSFVVGMRSGSGIDAMSLGGLEHISYGGVKPFAINRILEPITGRAEQVVNRISQESMFIPTGERMGAGGNFVAGGVGVDTKGKNILWSEAVTGGTNKAMLLDVGVHKSRGSSGRIYNALEGSGQAYHMGNDLIRKGFTIPISDPVAHKGLSTDLLNRIMNQKPGEMVELTKEEMLKGRNLLGIGPSGPRYLTRDPRLESIRVTHAYTRNSADKQTLHLVGDYDARRESMKLFSRNFKGTLFEVREQELMRDLAEYGVTDEVLKSYGIPKHHLVVASGEMLKKAPASFIRQMMSGYGMVTGVQDWEGSFTSQAESILKAQTAGKLSSVEASLIHLADGKGINQIGLSSLAAMKAMRNKFGPNMSTGQAEAAGRVLAAVYNRALDDEGTWLKGQHSGMRMQRSVFERAVKDVFGSKADDVLRVAGLGMAIGADTGSLGEGISDWRTGRGSIEPRLIENLQSRLHGLGMSNAQVSDIVSGIYKRKVGYGDHLRVVDNMTKMAASIKGMRNVTDELGGAPARFTVEQLQEQLTMGGYKSMSSFLKTQDQGIILDLKAHSDVRTGAAMRAAAEGAFGGQAEVFLPGGEAIDAMRGTFIKTVAGQEPVEIGSDYERHVDRFSNDLQKAIGKLADSDEALQKTFTQFSKDSVHLAATVFQQLGSGKIKGSAFQVAGKYDVQYGTGLTAAQRELVSSTVDKTLGTAAFMDRHGFLSLALDYGKSEPYNRKETFRRTAWMLETFFTGMEEGVGKRTGIASFGVRHPVLAQGNVALTQIFRDVREVGLKHDPVFEQIKASEWGAKYLDKFEGGVESFADVAKHHNRNARKSLFRAMTRNLADFTGGEGGGRLFMPSQEFKVHFGNASEKVDFGIASAALGDFDGDQWAMFLVDKNSGQRIMSTLDNNAQMKSYLRADALYKIKAHTYAEQAKAGLDVIAERAGHMDYVEMVAQDAMKEKASKEATGILDVRLNELRRAVQNMGGDIDSRLGASALLQVLEEHTTIKGKKLPVYQPLAESLGEAVDVLMRTGDAGQFRTVLQEQIFVGQDIMGEGLSVTGISDDAPDWVQRDVVGSQIRLDDEIATITKAANMARSKYSRYATGGSPKELANAMLQGGYEGMTAMRDIFFAESSIQGGMASAQRPAAQQAYSAMGAMGDQIVRAMGSANKKGLGALVMGVGGSLAALGMLGDPGYHPEPLNAPGEVPAPRVKDAMAAGAVFSYQNSSGMSADDLKRKEDRYAMMDRPINTGTTYMSRGNSYQVGMETSHPGAFGSASQFMSQMSGMGGSTSVTINDTRRPITRNYMDRLTGEY